MSLSNLSTPNNISAYIGDITIHNETVTGDLNVLGTLDIGNINLTNDLEIDGKLIINNTSDDSISTKGGAIIEKSVEIKEDLTVNGTLTTKTIDYEQSEIITSTEDSSGLDSGSSQNKGGASINKSLYIGYGIHGLKEDDSTNKTDTNASLVLLGGASIKKSIYANKINANVETNSISAPSDTLDITADNTNLTGDLDAVNISCVSLETTGGQNSTNYSTGDIHAKGGISTENNINAFGNISSLGILGGNSISATNNISSVSGSISTANASLSNSGIIKGTQVSLYNSATDYLKPVVMAGGQTVGNNRYNRLYSGSDAGLYLSNGWYNGNMDYEFDVASYQKLTAYSLELALSAGVSAPPAKIFSVSCNSGDVYMRLFHESVFGSNLNTSWIVDSSGYLTTATSGGVTINSDVTDASGLNSASMQFNGGVSVAKQTHFGDSITIHNISDANKNTNLLTDTAGNLLINSSGNIINIHATDQLAVLNVSDASSISDGSLVTSGGISCAKRLHTGNDIVIHNIQSSSNYSTLHTDNTGDLTITPTGNDTTITGNLNITGSLTLTNPLTVANGGIGRTSQTAYAPICGGTSSTNAQQSASTGISTSGYVLTSNGASALPSFQAVPSASNLTVSQGGTGVTSFTNTYAPICAGTTTTGNLQQASTGISTSGYVLTSNGASALPSFQAVPSSSFAWSNRDISSLSAYGSISNSPANYWHSYSLTVNFPNDHTFSYGKIYQQTTNSCDWGLVVTSGNTVVRYTGVVTNSSEGLVILNFTSSFTLTANTTYRIWTCGRSSGTTIVLYGFGSSSAFIGTQAEGTNGTQSNLASYNPTSFSLATGQTFQPWAMLY